VNIHAVFLRHRGEQWIDSLWVIELSAKTRLSQITKAMLDCGVTAAAMSGWITTIKLEDGRLDKK
jgi:hypothetical protein